MAINSVGQVAGSSQTPNGYIHAFRASDGIFEDLGRWEELSAMHMA